MTDPADRKHNKQEFDELRMRNTHAPTGMVHSSLVGAVIF